MTARPTQRPQSPERRSRNLNWSKRACCDTKQIAVKVTQSGFKSFRMSICRPLIEAAKIDRFGFDVELIYLAHLAGLRLCEIPVRWNHDPASKVSVMRDSFRMIDEVRRVRRDAAHGIYD